MESPAAPARHTSPHPSSRWLPAAAALLAPVALLIPGLAGATVLGADTGLRFDYTPAQLTETCKSALADARAAVAKIDQRAKGPVSIAEGLGAIEGAVAELSDRLTTPTQMNVLAVDRGVRDAASQCSDDYQAFLVELAADPAVYALAVAAKQMASDPEDEQLAAIYIENGKRAGAHLPDAQRARVKELLVRINSLQIEFQRAVAEDKTVIELTPAEVAPLPEALKAQLEEVAGTNRKSLRVSEATISPFMQQQSSREARLRFLTLYDRRGGVANTERMAKAVALRQRVAPMLGYKTWADYQLASKMAGTPKRALDLVDKVSATLLPKARAELAVLAQLKKADGDASPVEAWDYPYYEHELEVSRYAVDKEAVRAYFPVDKVVPAVMDIYSRLLGVRFDAIKEPKAWAPLIREYAIYDAASGAGLGWLYLDLYPREGKYGHFACGNFRVGHDLPGGGYQLPVATMMGNWPLPKSDTPSLLSHYEVETFFHEFGHAMHETLSHTHHASLYGAATRIDFVEAPSQMLENWMWQPAVLKKVSAHWQTGEPLPDELIQKMIAARHVADGVYWTRQTFFGVYDLQMHLATGKVDPTQLWLSLRPKLTLMHDPPGTYANAAFEHLMGAGYDGGYYGYLWSKVFAQDMFSEFEKAGLENPEVGLRYRREILLPGGSAEPDVLLRRFLGREVSYEPFYSDLGISSH